MSNRLFTPFPILKTARLVLRQLECTDAIEIFALRSNEQVNRYLNRQPCKSIEAAKFFIQSIAENILKNESVYWAIALNGKLVGTICLFGFEDDGTKAEIGYELLPGFQNKGFMQEAASKVLEFAFQYLGLHSITAYTHPENQNSVKLLEKLNFKNQSSLADQSTQSFLIFQISNNQS